MNAPKVLTAAARRQKVTEEAGTHKWVNVDDLTMAGQVLTHFGPGEIVRVKGRKFEVQRVQLEPPELRLVPVKKAR